MSIHYHPSYWRRHTQEIVRENPFKPDVDWGYFVAGFVCGLSWAGGWVLFAKAIKVLLR